MSDFDFDDREPVEFYTETKVRARKPHKCCDTHRMIQSGEFYYRISFKFEGKISSFSQSLAACHFARWLSHGKGSGRRTFCIEFGGMFDHVEHEDGATRAEWERVCAGEITRTT